MAERKVSPRSLRESMYVPEEDPQYRGFMNDPSDYPALRNAMIQAGTLIPMAAYAGMGAKVVEGAPTLAKMSAPYVATARDVLMRRMGMQTPAARQAASRLIEPGAADAALTTEAATPMVPRVAAGTMLAGSLPMLPSNSRSPISAVDEGHLNPQLFGVQRPTAGMDRTNTLGVDELSAYPAGAIHNYNRENAMGVDELSAYPIEAIHNYNRSDAPGINEMGAYAKPVVQMARRQVASRMPETIDLNTKGAASQAQPSTGFFSSFGNRPLTTRQAYQQSVDNPDDAGAWMRAERQYSSTHKEDPNFNVTKLDDSGMNRGGSVGGKLDKDAALHKALEIIHHMLRSR